MGYSTRQMHIAILEASKDKVFKDNFAPLDDISLQRLFSATDHALELGMSNDVTVIATFCSYIYVPTSTLESLIRFLETHGDVKRIAGINPSCVTILTHSSFIVTILLISSTKFIMEAKVLANAETGTGDDDSFEDVEDLTQRVNTILKAATPRK
jgi:hypothetical protein